MEENNSLDFFASGRRIKKDDPTPARSPLDSGNKWNISENTSSHSAPQIHQPKEQTPNNNRPQVVQPEQTQTQTQEQEIGSVGSELQKFRKYPAKTYDKFLNKMVTFNEEEFYLIRDMASEISMARKKSNIPNKGSLPRITENTVIRAALKALFSKIGKTSTDLTTLQTEEALEAYFNSLLK